MHSSDDKPSQDGNTKGLSGFTDVHCHCLPGLDDGPRDISEALALCRALVADGITQVVATPHQLGRFDGRCNTSKVRKAVAELQQRLNDDGIPLTVLPGADVRLDERIPQLVQCDRVLTVADGGRYLLLELPHEIFIDPRSLLEQLRQAGITTVMTHPERHAFLMQQPSYVQRWDEYRPCLQLTAASLVGEFGRHCQEAAWVLLDLDLPVVIATDAHNTDSRAPRMTAAYRCLVEEFGRAAADLMCIENPRRLVAGQEALVWSAPLRRRT